MAMTLTAPYRQATAEDAEALAELINFAGEGLPHYLWSKMIEGDETAWDVGRRRAKREEGSFSFKNAIVVDDEEIKSTLIGYRLPDEPEPIDYETMPAMFVPLQELENLAPATWYVNVLATFPDHRGQGHGAGLLELALRLAAASQSGGLSIIVSDANSGARRLYERCGYSEIAARPMVKESWDNPGQNWVLLTRAL